MADENNRQNEPENQEPWVPASPIKRIMAWTGIVYMILAILLNVYPFFNKGEYLYGVYPLGVCPAAAGLLAIAICQLRNNTGNGKRILMIALAIASCVLFALGLIQGLPPLLAALGGK